MSGLSWFKMGIFYNLIFLIFGLCYLPFFLFKIRQADDPHRLLSERLGRFHPSWSGYFSSRRVVWIHAVSVGEVMAVEKFVRQIPGRFEGMEVVLTSVTPAGHRVALRVAAQDERIRVFYFPFDFDFCVRKFFAVLRPQALLLTETEIWPNLLREAGKARVPVGIINGRLSLRSSRGYRHFGIFFRPLFRKLAFVLAQTEEDAARYRTVGVDSGKVHVLGNIKFDNAVPVIGAGERRDLRENLRRHWGFQSGTPLLIAGSTHPGEEEVFMDVCRALRGKFPGLKMIVAPRHVERAAGLEKMFIKNGLRISRASETGVRGEDGLLLDRIGILKQMYAAADIAFVGGTFVKRRGGQSPIEPAAAGCAVLHGPYFANFKEIYGVLDDCGAAFCVRSRDEFLKMTENLLEIPESRDRAGQNAVDAVARLQGATPRHLEWLSRFFMPELFTVKG